MVFDRFHIMRHIVKAVDTVRKQEHRELKAGRRRNAGKSKYLWLNNPENMTDQATRSASRTEGAELKSGPSVGDQGGLAGIVELRR